MSALDKRVDRVAEGRRATTRDDAGVGKPVAAAPFSVSRHSRARTASRAEMRKSSVVSCRPSVGMLRAMIEKQQLEAGIDALEAQRGVLGDAVVDAAIEGLRSKLAALQAHSAAEPSQTLRHVTILFLDAVGSTALGSRLDPEEISAVMDGLLSRATAVVNAHGGKVLKYTGDNLLAVFGADEVAEDDAARAVRCGLALAELGKAVELEVQAAYQYAGFNLRIGIHTGEALLGGGVDEEGSIRGQAVNIAARMEQ